MEEPTRPELEPFFLLDDVDRDLIALFLVDDPLDVPWAVIEHLAAQLQIEDASGVKRYTQRAKTA